MQTPRQVDVLSGRTRRSSTAPRWQDGGRLADWDPSNYLRFEDYRTRPALDLVSRVRVAAPKTVIDLGCGPGNSTQVLQGRWPAARVQGLDSSPGMISVARENHPDQEWALVLHGSA